MYNSFFEGCPIFDASRIYCTWGVNTACLLDQVRATFIPLPLPL